jgi:hypothetical protein
MGWMLARKLSIGVQLSRSNLHNPDAIDSEQLYNLGTNDKGIFVKKIVRSGAKAFSLIETSYNSGSLEELNQDVSYKSADFRFAIYPGRNKEFSFYFKQLRIEDQNSRNYAALSHTNFLNKNNGLEIKLSRQDNAAQQSETAVMLGWKIRH